MTEKPPLDLHPDRYFSSNTMERKIARHLYDLVKDVPLLCPHGHVDAKLFAINAPFPDPTELLIIPDHYLFRLLYSQGIPLESLGIPRIDGGASETDHRKIWQIVGDNFHLFRGTPTGAWLKHEMVTVLGVNKRLTGETAMEIYDQIQETLQKPENLPRAMFERFHIEVLSTTDAPTDTLEFHKQIRQSGWNGKIIPAFRPDNVTDFMVKGWRQNITKLADVSGVDTSTYSGFIQALESRRAFFQEMGATSTDQGVTTPFTIELTKTDAATLYDKAMRDQAAPEDARLFTGHMIMEMARMSLEDGMTMQVHPGVIRNHNTLIYQKFGADKGGDIPSATDYVNNLKPLLNKYGNDSRLNLIMFTIDETSYSRELAPLAGHYPALKVGPAWWFHDSREGMLRYRRLMTETAGFYNGVGFNDDTRAFPSIPARHDVARRIDARYLAELVAEHVLDLDEAEEVIVDLAYFLAKKNYRL
ncbi:glucuronate isomerase [candidate division KSB1 bacterium]|nr:glucuronate isomerase [candidate division KSB1 bacterium]RQW03036.1 MAG: glucuronate isomerase [candidate division KSB1 bacterium]